MNKQCFTITGYIENRIGMLPRFFAIFSRRCIRPERIFFNATRNGDAHYFVVKVCEDEEVVRKISQQITKQQGIWNVTAARTIECSDMISENIYGFTY